MVGAVLAMDGFTLIAGIGHLLKLHHAPHLLLSSSGPRQVPDTFRLSQGDKKLSSLHLGLELNLTLMSATLN